MKPSYLKLIDNNSDHWIEATLKNYLIHLFQKHKQKLDFDTFINYLQTDLDLQIRDKTLLNSIWFEIDTSEYNSNQSEATEKWNEVILRDIYDSFEREVIANLEIGNHRQFWKEYQWHVFYPIAKKAFYKYANRNSLNQNLEIYNKSISDEFKKIITKHSNIDAISSFIKKFTSKERISLSYFLLFIKYFYIIEFLKGNVKLEDQTDIDNYLRNYLDIQIFYFFEVFNTSVKLESYFSKSTESLSSILIDDNLKKNFDNEKRLRETLDSIIKIHTTKIEDFYTSNEIKINELLNAVQVEKETVLNISNEIQKSQNEFNEKLDQSLERILSEATLNIDNYLEKYNRKLEEFSANNSQQQQQMQTVNIAINQKQKDLEKTVAEIADYEKRIERNLKKQVVLFSKRDLNNRQKAYDSARKKYKAKRTIYKNQKSANKKRIVFIGFVSLFFLISLGFFTYFVLTTGFENLISLTIGCFSIIAMILIGLSSMRYFSAREYLNIERDSLQEDNKELLEMRKEKHELAQNFNRDTESSYTTILNVAHISGVQVGSGNNMDNKNTNSFRDTQAPFKVTDFSKG